MKFTFADLLVLLGLSLSFFLVVLLWSSKSFRSDVQHFFALAIISLNLSLTIAWFEEWVPSNGILEIISWPFLFPFAFMLYVLKAIRHPLASSRYIWVLLLPCAILSIFQLIDFTLDFDVYSWLVGAEEQAYEQLIEGIYFTASAYSVALLGFSHLKIQQAKNIYAQERSWLQFNSLSILIFCVVWLFSDFIRILFDIGVWPYLLVFLGIFLTLTTYRGVHQLNVFEQRRQLKQMRKEAQKKKDSTSNENKINRSDKTAGKIEKLQALMRQEQLYLNPELSRSMVANRLGLSDGYLSELLSSSLNSSFNDYINEFRVHRAIAMFRAEEFDVFSVEAIGCEAGFKSKSVFYKAFKKVTQKTPGAYRKSLNMS